MLDHISHLRTRAYVTPSPLLRVICLLILVCGGASLSQITLASEQHYQEKEAEKTKHHIKSPKFTRKKIKTNIHLLQGKGGNILVLNGEEGLLVVDVDYQDMTTLLINELNTFDHPVRYIINTHWHGDHTGGNHTLGKKAPIIAHQNVKERLSKSQSIPLFNMVTSPYPKEALPSITYRNSLEISINDETVKLFHFPKGHTDGDSIVYFKKADVLHTGDLYFNGMFPFVDLNSNGSVQQVAKNVVQILEMITHKTIIIPGHGPVSRKKELHEYYRMLKGSLAEVKAMYKKGFSLTKIQEAGLSSEWDRWKNGFISEADWIKIVHESILSHEP